MIDDKEQVRLAALYEQLRIKLLDLSKRNRMLNYPLGARSRRHVQIVDAMLDEAYSNLLKGEVLAENRVSRRTRRDAAG